MADDETHLPLHDIRFLNDTSEAKYTIELITNILGVST